MPRFQQEWAAKYLCPEVKGKAVSLVCGPQDAEFKDYSLNRHCNQTRGEITCLIYNVRGSRMLC